MAKAPTPAIAALLEAGIDHEVLTYPHDPRHRSYGDEAVAALASATMADPAAAQRSTGYVVGGISPLGQRTRLPTVIDSSASTWDRVLCSAGKRGMDVAVPPAALIALTDAVVADIGLR